MSSGSIRGDGYVPVSSTSSEGDLICRPKSIGTYCSFSIDQYLDTWVYLEPDSEPLRVRVPRRESELAVRFSYTDRC